MKRLPATLVLLGGFVSAQQPLTDLVDRLGSPDSRTCSDAYRELQRRRDPKALPLLVKRVPGFPMLGQSYGISLLYSYSLDQREAAYRSWVKSSSPYLVVAAGAALYQRGDTSAVGAIRKALGAAKDDQLRYQMVSRLTYTVKDEGVRAMVRTYLATAHVNLFSSSVQYLLECDDRAAIEPVRRRVGAGEPNRIRALAAAFLVAMGETAHAKDLADALDGKSRFSEVRQLLRRAPNLPDPVLAAVLAYAESAKTHERRYALQFLADRSYRQAVPLLKEMLDSGDAQDTKAAFDALMKLGGGLPKKQLKKLTTAKSVDVRIAAADALRRLDDLSGLTQLVDIYEKGQKKREAIAALGKFRDPRAVPVLLDALADRDVAVRRSAQQGLVTVLRALFPYKQIDLRSTGYDAAAPAARRQTAVATLRAWWAKQNG